MSFKNMSELANTDYVQIYGGIGSRNEETSSGEWLRNEFRVITMVKEEKKRGSAWGWTGKSATAKFFRNWMIHNFSTPVLLNA